MLNPASLENSFRVTAEDYGTLSTSPQNEGWGPGEPAGGPLRALDLAYV